jgi:spore coat polysaccharide biosynthesis protein SpsF
VALAAIVQARLGSSRLPGKVLAEIEGKPLLAYLLERLRRAESLDGIVVATSDDPSDDELAEYCATNDIDCHRGPLEDVARRMLDAAEERGLSAFIRVSGDSPLLDPRLVDRAASLLGEDGGDVVTNVVPRTFPHGQSVEAIAVDAFRRACAEMTETHDREHVTPFLYRNAARFRIRSFSHETDLSSLQLAVDTREDLAFVRAIVGAMSRPHAEYGLEEIIGLAERLGPE